MWNYCRRKVSNLVLVKRCTETAENNYRKVEALSRLYKRFVSVPSIRLRGDKDNNNFDFKSMCFHCDTVGSLESSKDTCFPLRTFDCQCRLCDFPEKRKDEWRKAVLETIHQVIDLTPADVFYHQMCKVNFRTSKNIPLKYATLSNPKRRNSEDLLIRFGEILFAKLVLPPHM